MVPTASQVIYASGYSDDMPGDSSPPRRGPNFLEKPFNLGRLLQRIRNCLDGVNGQ